MERLNVLSLISWVVANQNMPTLVIHGKEDMIFPIDVGDHLNQSLSDSEFCIIPDASHQVFEEKYEEVAEVMWKFICSHM